MSNTFNISQKWAQCVEKIWKTQRTILYLTLANAALSIFSGVLLFLFPPLGAILLSLPALITLAIHVMDWVFIFKLMSWIKLNDQEDKKWLKIYNWALLIKVVTNATFILSTMLSVVPVINVIAATISACASGLLLVSLVMQLWALFKLRKAHMPEKARKGLSSILKHYIVLGASNVIGWVLALVGSIMFYGATFIFSNYIWIDFAKALMNGDVEEAFHIDEIKDAFIFDYEEEATKAEEEEDDSTLKWGFALYIISVVLTIGGTVIVFIGYIYAQYLYYRGWWLVGKSELEVVPEVIEANAEDAVVIECTEANEK
jgi:hypothetical protein